ncbi:methyltransferase domain-containing protein [Aliagarivorans taiwanensis]|uniref:methyltransferase domain-containing protein n=1 Tax=Aliagarivorans taiwanensis TaxID=561966 RepID=UPI00047C3BD1|nr:methyltransferase domain-containing protein [Aliagarivorans taiwanensis]
MNTTVKFYDQHAESLARQYQSVDADVVHLSWLHYWPQQGGRVLDVGAGSGRDSLWMAERGCDVFAVEPATALRESGKQLTGDKVIWLDDQLPTIGKVFALGIRFDLILVSAVWMHVPESDRARAFRKLSSLLAPNGRIVLTLRHGDFSDGRTSYGVSAEDVQQLAKNHVLLERLVTPLHKDELARQDVLWQTLVFELPDDGKGELTHIRRIIVNDSKSATYKLALLRTLLRIADAHPGAVSDRSDGKVVIPAGLVALYWMRQFKRLLDIKVSGGQGLQQSSNTSKGLGFVKADGWAKLTHLTAEHYSIGAYFFGDEAKALQRALSHALSTIKAGPVTYIYHQHKDNRLFDIAPPTQRRKNLESVVLDHQFLSSYGDFVLGENLWECLRIYGSWVEPLVVNQWIMEMQRFELNRDRNIMLQDYHDRLVWIDQEHNTREVRQRVEQLRSEQQAIKSVWSGSVLKNEYHVDHCMPFAYWPNNDRWNLLPTSKTENQNKRDRLPSIQRFLSAKGLILEWWQQAWPDESLQQCFFNQAALSLPNVPEQCRDFEEVFEAMGLQMRGVKARLQVGEW